MTNIFTPISAVTGGKKDLKLIVRVAHIWLICDKENSDDIIFMSMILVDEKRGRIHATVRKYVVPTIQRMVEEGGTYKLENVMVGFNEGNYKLLPHKYKLSMMGNARFTKVNASNVPQNVFEFMSFKDILISSEEDVVADVIGHIVEKDSVREIEKGKFVLEAKVISGSNIDEKVFIPRLSLSPSDVKIPFKFKRRQIPISVSFAMTINKSQGKSLKNVGIYLSSSVFSHGQLYVAIFRVTSKQSLKILIVDGDGENTNTTSNVVYHEVFRNVS